MNIYTVIILSALIFEFIIDKIAEFLNLYNLNKKLPDEFKDIVSEEEHKKSIEYSKTKIRLGFIVSTFDLIVFLVFWFSGGFPWLYNYVTALTENSIYQGLIYIGTLLIARSVLFMPFSVWSTFVIEEKFGFNKTTLKTYVLDRLKGLLLGLIVGIPFLALILYLLKETGENAWLYGWAVVTVFSLFMQYISPVVIMPLFNKFKVLENESLRMKIMELAMKINYPLKKIFIMDGSKRSSKSNAFFTGFGKNRKIVLFDTLIEKHTEEELIAVLAHEIGHYKKKHILISTLLGIIQTGILFYLLSLFLSVPELFKAFGINEMPVYAGLIFFGYLFAPVESIISVFFNVLSRKNEYEADNFAAKNDNGPDNLISALKKLSKDNLSNLTPHPFYEFLNYSHPSVLKRINTLKKI